MALCGYVGCLEWVLFSGPCSVEDVRVVRCTMVWRSVVSRVVAIVVSYDVVPGGVLYYGAVCWVQDGMHMGWDTALVCGRQ